MKDLYVAPEVQVIDMELQGVIAVSGGPYSNPDVENTDI